MPCFGLPRLVQHFSSRNILLSKRVLYNRYLQLTQYCFVYSTLLFLVLHYDFNNTTQEVIRDISGYGNNAYLENGAQVQPASDVCGSKAVLSPRGDILMEDFRLENKPKVAMTIAARLRLQDTRGWHSIFSTAKTTDSGEIRGQSISGVGLIIEISVPPFCVSLKVNSQANFFPVPLSIVQALGYYPMYTGGFRYIPMEIHAKFMRFQYISGGFHFEVDDGKVRWFHRNNDDRTVFDITTSDQVVQPNTWHHIMGTYDSVAGQAKVILKSCLTLDKKRI